MLSSYDAGHGTVVLLLFVLLKAMCPVCYSIDTKLQYSATTVSVDSLPPAVKPDMQKDEMQVKVMVEIW